MKNNIESASTEGEGINIQETGIVRGSLERAIGSAPTFDELFVALRTAGRVVGSGDRVYRADDLISRISEFKDSFDFQDEESKQRLVRAMSDEHVMNQLLHKITRSNGLRKKVAELIIKGSEKKSEIKLD